MATARENDNPYNGLGAGGKFRKKPYRRAQSTPYDRPPTVIRNPSIVGGGGAGGAYNGWLRKIVDPAQKLVMSTAHRLFSSVFTKRLTHPPPLTPQPPVSSEKQEATNEQNEAFSMDTIEEQETATKRGQNSEDGCVKDLEKILKQKTFTTSEVDHLMSLLRERDVDKPVEKEQKASKLVSFHEQREELTNTMVPDHDTESFPISSKPTNSAVFIEDAGSPTELAKAYMGSRPSKESPSVLGLRNQAIAEDSRVLTSLTHLSKSPILSILPRPSAHVGSRENGYVTPRPRGRSAIYSMARSPYSRGHLTATPKSSRPIADCLDGSSPATQPWNGSGSSALKALKRSSSVFENDIGSAASTRRFRQKPNLSYQKNWLIPVPASGVASSTDYQPSSSVRKMHSVSGRNHTFTEQSARTNSKIPPVSSKSSEMASRILQQLDTIVSPPKERPSVLKLATVREKAPAMMSPSKLHGQALKSLEHIDSSKFLEMSNNQDGSVGTSQQNSKYATSEKKGSDQNGLSNTFVGLDKLSPPVSSLTRGAVQKDSLPSERSTVNNFTNSLVNSPMQKKRAFKMSAHEDYVDMEDDSYCNGDAAPKLDGKAKQNTFLLDHTLSVDQSTAVDKPSSVFDGTFAISGVKELASKDVNAGQTVADKRVEFSFSSAIASTSPASSAMTQSTLAVDRSVLPNESKSAVPAVSFGDKVSSLKDQDTPTSPLSFVANNGSVASSANEAEGKHKQSALSSDSKPKNLTSFVSAGASPFLFRTKAQESAKAEDDTASKDGVAMGAPEPTSVPALSTSSASFSFGIDPVANLSNGSIISSPVTFGSTGQNTLSSSHVPVVFGGSAINAVPPTGTVAAASSITSNAEQCSSAAPAFKFGLPTTTPASTAPFTSSAAPSTAFSKNVDGNSVVAPVFGLNAATATTSGAQESVSTGAAKGPSAQVSESLANKTRIAALSQSIPAQFGTFAASSSASSNSLFASSSVANLSPSASLFGSSSVASSVASSSSLLGSTVPVFGGSTFKAPSVVGFSFGGSTSSTTAGSSTSFSSTGSTTSSAATGNSTSSTSAPNTFGSTSTTLSAASTGIFQFGSAGSTSSPTGAASTFGLMTGSAAGTSPFGSMGTSTTGSPIFGLNGTSSSASTGALTFGSSATSSASTAPSTVFGFTSGSTFPFTSAAPKASSSPTFGFGATAAPGTSSSAPAFQFGVATTPVNSMSPQPSFPISNSVFGFGSSAPASNSSHNNDQMNTEDTMAEDSVQHASAALSPAPVFGQQPISPSPVGFAFGTGGAANPNPFQFGTPPQQQQQQLTIQNPSPFQASGSLDFNAGGGGSFSLGTGGGDKSSRRIVKVRKSSQRRK